MATTIEIVRYQPTHRVQALQLQRLLWGNDQALNDAYFAWKYETNPYLTEPAVCLALDGGEVIGMRGIMGAKWCLGASGRSVRIPCTDDFILAPAYRGQGLSPLLIRATCDYARDLGDPYLLSLRANIVNLLACLGTGYRSIGTMQQIGRTSAQGARFNRVRDLLGRSRLIWRLLPLVRSRSDRHPFENLDRQLQTSSSSDSPIRVARIPDPEAMAALHERLPTDPRIHHVRDREYFDWVFRNPRLDYRFVCWQRERLEGYLVLHRHLPPADGQVYVWISDWEGTSETVRSDLLEAAVRLGQFDRLATWSATFPESAQGMFERHGFEPINLAARARGLPAAIIRPTNDEALEREWTLEGRAVKDLANWKLRLLDQD